MSKYEEEISKHVFFSFGTMGKLESSETNKFLSLTGQRNHNYLKTDNPTENLNSEIAPPSHSMDKVILAWTCFFPERLCWGSGGIGEIPERQFLPL